MLMKAPDGVGTGAIVPPCGSTMGFGGGLPPEQAERTRQAAAPMHVRERRRALSDRRRRLRGVGVMGCPASGDRGTGSPLGRRSHTTFSRTGTLLRAAFRKEHAW